MKPEDIPQDVWDKAEEAFDLMLCNCIEASGTAAQFRTDSIEPHARAIMAAKAEEREKCSSVVERMGIPRVIENDRILMLPPNIAEAIRKRV